MEVIEQARARLAQGDAAGSHALLLQALQQYQASDDRAGGAAVLHELGQQATRRGEYEPAESLLRRAIQLRLALDDRVGWIESVFELALLERQRGQRVQANDMLARALFMARQIDYTLYIARCLHEMGTLQIENGNLNEAEALFRESLDTSTLNRDTAGQAATLYQMGLLAQSRHDVFAAADHFRRSLAICEQTADEPGQIANLSHLGAVYQTRRRAADAETYFRRAAELARHARRADLEAENRGLLGRLLFERGDFPGAFDQFAQAQRGGATPTLGDWIPALYNALGPEAFLARARQAGLDHVTLRTGLQQAAPDGLGPQSTLAQLVAARLRLGPQPFAALAQQSQLTPEMVARVETAAQSLSG